MIYLETFDNGPGGWSGWISNAAGPKPLEIRRMTAVIIVALGFLAASITAPHGAEAPLETTVEIVATGQALQVPADFKPPTPYSVSDHVPSIGFARYPLPDKAACKWSHWGPGAVLPDGRVLTSLGDHCDIDGNSYLYEYDPATHVLRLVADLQSAVADFEEGDFGFGKIHDRLNIGADGNVYFASYWGLRSGYDEEFQGERLFRYNPASGELTDLGMPKAGWGYPSSNFAPQHGLYYAEAAYRPDYDNETRGRQFFVFDINGREIRFMNGHEGTGYGRDLFTDRNGNAYFNNGDRTLVKYDPVANDLTDLGPVMPVSRLRRTAGPDIGGMLYATSSDTDASGRRILFSFAPRTLRTRTIAALWADTPAMALHPRGRYVYMVPGNITYPGRPLIRTDLRDGSIEVVAFLAQAIQDEQDFTLGGTYSLCVDNDTAYIEFGVNNDMAFVTVGLPPHSDEGSVIAGSRRTGRRR